MDWYDDEAPSIRKENHPMEITAINHMQNNTKN